MLKMRLWVVVWVALLVCGVSSVQAGPSEDTFGELAEPLEKKVAIDLIGTPLPRALETLARESGINILIAPQFTKTLSNASLTLTIRDLPTSKALNLIGLATGTDWYIQDGVVLVATNSYVRSLNVEMRVFDIGGLLESVPNFTGQHLSLDGTFSNTSSGGSSAGFSDSFGKGGAGGGLFGDDSDTEEDLPSRQELVSQITDLITATTGEKDDWLDEIYTITEYKSNLIVRSTPEVGDEIAKLLERLSGMSGRMVSVEGQYFAVPRTFLDELDGKLVLDAEGYKALSAKLERGAQTNVRRISSGRTICFNAQRVYVYAASEQAILTDVEPIPDAFSIDPTLSTLHRGAVLDIKPTITLDGKQVSVALRSDVVDQSSLRQSGVPVGTPPAGSERVSTSGELEGEVELDDDETAPITGTVRGGGTKRAPGANRIVGEAALDLPEQEILSLRTNVRIPDGGAVVLSGVSSQFLKIDADGMEVILVLRVRIND
ncbi:MAG: hypothetical protein AAGB26_01945 [Planctomycetota bacterium]